MSRKQGFGGGLFLPDCGGGPEDKSGKPFPLPATLDIPLRGHDGPAARPEVSPGDWVEAGQRIGCGDSPGALHVHAPASGRVTALVSVNSMRESSVTAVRITTRQEPAHSSPPHAEQIIAQLPPDFVTPTLDDLIHAAERAGLTDFQPEPRSLADQLRIAADRRTRHLIVNMLPGEPTGVAPSPPANEELAAIVRLAKWIGAGIGAKRVRIVADASDPRTLKRLRATARRSGVRIVQLVNKYPQHAPVLLAVSLLGIETPPGQGTTDVGVTVLQAEAILHLANALPWPGHEPVPMTHRLVTVAGSGLARPGRYWIPIGTSFRDILCHVGLIHTPKRVVEGGPLTGRAVAHLDVVTTKQTASLLVLDRATDRTPRPGPCIRCGWCQEDCPVGLDPRTLLNIAERGEPLEAAPFFPQACIECGVCSYVCPANLPLAQASATLKRVMHQTDATSPRMDGPI